MTRKDGSGMAAKDPGDQQGAVATTGGAVNMMASWAEGKESDFQDLRKAIKEGRTQKYETGDPDPSSSEEDEDQSEPPQGQTGARALWAAQYGKLTVLEHLLAENPALTHHRDEDGYTPLHRASYSGRYEVVRELLAAGADPDARTSDGWTPLHSACRWNQGDCADLLLAAGAGVNAQTNGGHTPLHLAAVHGRAREVLQVLLTSALVPDPGIRNQSGDTPGDIAARNGNCIEYFRVLEEKIFLSALN